MNFFLNWIFLPGARAGATGLSPALETLVENKVKAIPLL